MELLGSGRCNHARASRMGVLPAPLPLQRQRSSQHSSAICRPDSGAQQKRDPSGNHDVAQPTLHTRLALHVDSFEAAPVRRCCLPWLLDHFCFLSDCARPVCAAVCAALATYVCWLGILSLIALCLLAWCAAVASSLVAALVPCVAHVWRSPPPPFHTSGSAETEDPLG
jgi:hypothetical protein